MLAEDPTGRGRAEAQHHVGPVPRRELGHPQQRVVGRDRERTAPQPRRRVGEHGPRAQLGDAVDQLGIGARAPTRHDDAAGVLPDEGGDPGRDITVGHPRRRLRHRPRRVPGPSRCVDQRRSRRHQRLAEGQVPVHGSRQAGPRRPPRCVRPSLATTPPHRARPRAGPGRRTTGPRRRRAGSGPPSGARPRARSSGGRSAVATTSGTRPRSASSTAGWKLAAAVPDVHSTTAGRPVARPIPSGCERGRPLVEEHVHGDAIVGRERVGHGRGPGPGRDAGVGHAVAHPLVDDGPGERGVRVPAHRAPIRTPAESPAIMKPCA